MTDNECKVLLALAAKATPGPIASVKQTFLKTLEPTGFFVLASGMKALGVLESEADCYAVAAACNAVPGLIEDRRRMVEALEHFHGCTTCGDGGGWQYCETGCKFVDLLRDMRGKEQGT